MAVIDMTLKDNNQADAGTYYNKVTLADTGASDIYFLPISPAVGIAASLSGDAATLELTNDPREVIKADEAVWGAWDGFSIINPGITAFRLKSAEGSAEVRVSVRTNSTGVDRI